MRMSHSESCKTADAVRPSNNTVTRPIYDAAAYLRDAHSLQSDVSTDDACLAALPIFVCYDLYKSTEEDLLLRDFLHTSTTVKNIFGRIDNFNENTWNDLGEMY